MASGSLRKSTVLENVARAVGANVFSLTLSTALVLVVPRMVGVADYGYWQLYSFCLSWVGVLHFGWIDGVYLKVAGTSYDTLDFRKLGTQFWCCLVWMCLLGVGVAAYGISAPGGMDPELSILFVLLGPGIVLVCSNTFLNFTLQATGRITEYAKITVIERSVFACLVLSSVAMGLRDFYYLLGAEIAARSTSFIYLTVQCPEIAKLPVEVSKSDLREIADNVRVGFKLLIANLASLGVIGVARLMIQLKWGVDAFGQLSLVLGVSSLGIAFVSAVAIVAFPLLRRASVPSLPGVFVAIRSVLTYSALAAMLAYFPLREFLSTWLSAYADGLRYLVLLFPLCLYEGKMALLVSSFWKAMRKERLMARLNLAAVAFATIWSAVAAFVFGSLDLCVLGIIVTVALRSMVGEALVGRTLGVSTAGRSLVWSILVMTFMALGYSSPAWLGVGIQAILLVIVLLADRRQVVESCRYLRAASQERR